MIDTDILHQPTSSPNCMGKLDDCSSFTNTNLRCPEHLEIPIAVSEIPIAVSEIPVAVSEIPVAVSEIPVAVSEIPVAVSEIPSAVILFGTCEIVSDGRVDAMVMMGISIAKYSW